MLTAQPGNLLEVYTRDLLAITESMSLRGQSPGSPGCRVLAFCERSVADRLDTYYLNMQRD